MSLHSNDRIISALTIFGGFASELAPSDLPAGPAVIAENCDFDSVGAVRTRDGLSSQFSYPSLGVSSHASSGVNAGPANNAIWANPNNITLNTLGDNAAVTLNLASTSLGLIQAHDGVMANNLPCFTSFTSNVTAGNMLVAHWSSLLEYTQIPVISDTLLNTWVPIFLSQDPTSGTYQGAWYAIANGSGADTVSVSGGLSFNGVAIAEFIGINTVDQISASVLWQGSVSGQTMASNPITTNFPNEVLFSFATQSAAGFGGGSGVQSPMAQLTETTAAGYTFSLMGYEIISSLQTGFQAHTQLGNASNNGQIQLTSLGSVSSSNVSQVLEVAYAFNLPPGEQITGLQLSITGQQGFVDSNTYLTATLGGSPNASPSVQFQLPLTNGTVTVTNPLDTLWGQGSLGNQNLISLLNSGQLVVNIKPMLLLLSPSPFKMCL